jgi:RNA polymerase sigma factor (sigma-70 family)
MIEVEKSNVKGVETEIPAFNIYDYRDGKLNPNREEALDSDGLPHNLPFKQWSNNQIERYAVLTKEEAAFFGSVIRKYEQAKLSENPNNSFFDFQRLEQEAQIAENALVLSNLRLVRKFADKEIWDGKVDYEDLFQEGFMGLREAAKKYDPTIGVFSTHASEWIVHCMGRCVENDGRTIRIPSHMHEKIRKLNTAYYELINLLNRRPTPEELSQYSGISVKTATLHLYALEDIVSLDGISGDQEVMDRLQDPNIDVAEEAMQNVIAQKLQQEWPRIVKNTSLQDRELQMLQMDAIDEISRSAIGKHFDVSRQRATEIIEKTGRKIFNHIQDNPSNYQGVQAMLDKVIK